MALSLPAGAASGRARTDFAAQQVDAAHHVLAALDTPGAPPGLERLAGLVRAYVGTLYGDATAPPLEIDITDGLVVDWLDEAVAFRIVQLAAQNVALHAQARTIVVRLREQDAVLVVEVVDDGVGFDPATTTMSTPTSGTGIATMQALAALAGGHVDIESAPGHGTRVTATLSGSSHPAPSPGGHHLQLVSGDRPRPARR